MRSTEENNEQAARPGASEPPAISLPKGGGAIRGIGEKFAANPVTGTGSMTVPIDTSPGRSGFGPDLSLSYDSGAGNGPYGFGWSLTLPAITRKTDKGLPRYLDAEESDEFILSGAEDLVPVYRQNPDEDWMAADPGFRRDPEGWVHDADGKLVIHEESRNGHGNLVEPGSQGTVYSVRRYRPRVEGLFARIERWTRLRDGDIHWRSISGDNILTLYGKDTNSRIADPKDPKRIFSWLIAETRDDKGNAILYEYKPEDGTGVDLTRACERNRGDAVDPRRTANRYLKTIRYGNRTPLLQEAGQRPQFLTEAERLDAGWMFQVVFDYGEHHADTPAPDGAGRWSYRDDPFSSYRAGFEVRTTRLCQRVLMFHRIPDLLSGEKGYEGLVRSTDFTYSHEQDRDNARNPVYTFLRAVTQIGYKREGNGYLKRSLPPIEFEYTQPVVQDEVEEVDPTSLENLPIGIDGAAYQWTDLHGEGIPGILAEESDVWLYKRNLSPIGAGRVEFAPQERVGEKPNLSLADGARFMDLAGDGQPDLVVLDSPTPGLYEHDGKEGWQPFRPFTAGLSRDFRDPNLKFVDLDGNGHADLLISEHDAFVWHASLAEEGFGPARRVQQSLDEEKGPRLIFADGTESIYLADLSGDGLTDLARIRNGEVCYWPNLGYGRFGAKVNMDHAPWFDHPNKFDHKRLLLADIDGTGTTDIIYPHRDGVRLYFNQSGNGWSVPQVLRVFPRVDDLVAIAPTDLFGNGTACLVWSSPLPGDAPQSMRYVNLMGGQKPHLLVKTINNLGAETRVQYAPSTKFYLQDKREGKPWITRLPFPVHVVERVETYDHISRNRFVTRYAYHHGYFDGVEREFRGFGMVEQWDTEEIGTVRTASSDSRGTNLDEASFVPPVWTKTWFHTGVHTDRHHVSNYFAGIGEAAGEYYREPSQPGLTDEQVDAKAKRLLLEDTLLPRGLSPELTVEEEREACRALKGSILRQEVYALDDDLERSPHPYSVTERNYGLERVQPQAGNRHAVFFAHPRETLDYHYERNPADPRISHALMLEVDRYGNALKSLAIGCGRRPGNSTLVGDDTEKQERPLVTYTETDVTNAIDDPNHHRTPLPCEVRTYELTGYRPAEDAARFAFAEWAGNEFAAIAGAAEIPYGQTSDESEQQKRLIERVRTLYRKDDLSGCLPIGDIEPPALPGDAYKLAFTPRLLTDTFGEKEDGAELARILRDEGRYLDLDQDGHWWLPSGRVFYSTDPSHTAAQELAAAHQGFFLPQRVEDPFGQSTSVRYDRMKLLVEQTTDALGNSVRAENDYRVLQPVQVTDPNGNRSQVAFDALGMVVGTAVMGKADQTLGDSLEGFAADLTDAEALDPLAAPFASPHAILGCATTRLAYDLFAYQRTQAQPDPQPPVVYTLARETHDADLLPGEQTRIQHSFSYSDGFGREIQRKIQAEPGPVPRRDDEGKVILGADGQPEMTADDFAPRWVGSGWTVFNNKGNPVRQYEPFFSDTPRFEQDAKIGVSPVLFYDPVGRVIATLQPNHTYEKILFDPWQQVSYDLNDTVTAGSEQTGDPRTDPDIAGYVQAYFETQPDDWRTWYQQRHGGALGRQEQEAANQAAAHADTPTTAHFDALGRPFLTVAHNRVVCPEHELDGTDELLSTRVELDIEGNQRAVIDAKDRVVMRYRYDMLGNRIHQESMEAGARWMLNDVAGNPIRSWDSRGFRRRMTYDELRRPVGLYVSDHGQAEFLAEKTVYGDTLGALPIPEQTNHRGQPYQVFDGTGVVISEAYDFKGNLLRSSRQLCGDYKQAPDWQRNPELEDERFGSSTRYDALNRPIQMTAPHSDRDGVKCNILRPGYNQANLLERIDAWLQQDEEPGDLLDPQQADHHVVRDIDYDAKGQRTLIEYGNGAVTGYDYDPLTFRLTRMRTTRLTQENGLAGQLFKNPSTVQDLHHTYDPAGNVTRITDEAMAVTYHHRQAVKPVGHYVYDALYRLIEAQGREHIGQSAFQLNSPNGNYRDYPFAGLGASSNDATALRNYTGKHSAAPSNREKKCGTHEE
jgi:hypothetical protein